MLHIMTFVKRDHIFPYKRRLLHLATLVGNNHRFWKQVKFLLALLYSCRDFFSMNVVCFLLKVQCKDLPAKILILIFAGRPV